MSQAALSHGVVAPGIHLVVCQKALLVLFEFPVLTKIHSFLIYCKIPPAFLVLKNRDVSPVKDLIATIQLAQANITAIMTMVLNGSILLIFLLN